MVRDPSIVSPSLTGVFIGRVVTNTVTGSRCTLPEQCRLPSPRRRWRCDRWIELQEELVQHDPGGRAVLTSSMGELQISWPIAPSPSSSLVWTVFFAVSAAGYGGIWRDMAGYREIPGDTGRYREIPGDTRRYEIRADTGRDGEIRGDARRCKEIRGDTVRYWRDTSRCRKKPSTLGLSSACVDEPPPGWKLPASILKLAQRVTRTHLINCQFPSCASRHQLDS